jgi:hypothetical protein
MYSRDTVDTITKQLKELNEYELFLNVYYKNIGSYDIRYITENISDQQLVNLINAYQRHENFMKKLVSGLSEEKLHFLMNNENINEYFIVKAANITLYDQIADGNILEFAGSKAINTEHGIIDIDYKYIFDTLYDEKSFDNLMNKFNKKRVFIKTSSTTVPLTKYDFAVAVNDIYKAIQSNYFFYKMPKEVLK